MKKIFGVLVVVLFLAAFVVVPVLAQGENPPPTSPVELPIELQAMLAAGIGFLVTAGLKSLSVLLNKDISGWGSVITGGLATSVIYFFTAILSAVPVAAQPSVTIALTLLVSIVSAFGVASTVKKFQPG
jgi:hypothetical protein